MDYIEQYIGSFSSDDEDRIKVLWNGKRGRVFQDANQDFRELVINRTLPLKDSAPIPLCYALIKHEADWADKSWSYRLYLPILIGFLVELDTYTHLRAIIDAVTVSTYALDSLMDLKLQDYKLKQLIASVEKFLSEIDEADEIRKAQNVLNVLKELKEKRKTDKEERAAFDAYVKEKDVWHVALIKWAKYTYNFMSTETLALLVIVPVVMLMGIYLFGLSMVYALIPTVLVAVMLIIAIKFFF